MGCGAIFEPLYKLFGAILKFFYELSGNYGVAIILFTLAVNIILLPLTWKQQKSTTKMQSIQPELKKIQQKYKNDKEKLNMEMMKLYKDNDINPMGGCLPMLIQMPIIMGLFALLRNPMQYINSDGMLFAVHEAFMWIPDLSQPDKWILPLLAGAATFLSFFINQKNNTGSTAAGPAAQMNQSMKMMQYIFPIMIIWMGRSFPAGLALYWAIGQVMQIFFNMHMKTVREKVMKDAKNKKKKR